MKIDITNRVHSVAFTVLDGLFPYLVQMITGMRRCVACDDLWPWPISSRSFDLALTWDPTWLNSVGNHEAAGVSSERSCSSFRYFDDNSFKCNKYCCTTLGRLSYILQQISVYITHNLCAPWLHLSKDNISYEYLAIPCQWLSHERNLFSFYYGRRGHWGWFASINSHHPLQWMGLAIWCVLLQCWVLYLSYTYV